MTFQPDLPSIETVQFNHLPTFADLYVHLTIRKERRVLNCRHLGQ